jgi:hypothetical protein
VSVLQSIVRVSITISRIKFDQLCLGVGKLPFEHSQMIWQVILDVLPIAPNTTHTTWEKNYVFMNSQEMPAFKRMSEFVS